jgi:D-amino-acid dehydrogenase
MNPTSRHVVVIGGGVIGTACGYMLQRSGWRVTILDRGTLGGGSSGGNCGLVCPSHVLPLAEPGAVGATLRALFRKNSPFQVRPRLDPALWSWLLHFAQRCNADDMRRTGHAIQALLESSLTLYREWIDREALTCEWQARGLLFVYQDRALFEAYAPTDRLLADEFDCPSRRIDGEDLAAFDPALRPGLAGGWYYEEDAHLRPDQLLTGLRRLLERRGAAILERREFQGFRDRGRRALAVKTAEGAIDADAFVVATGAWTPLWNDHLDCRIPIQPGKGYSLTMPRPAICPNVPMIFPETRVAVTPFESGYRLGSTMEFAGYDESIPEDRLRLLKDGAAPYLQEPYREPVEERWYGWRPMTYDSLPVVDRCPKYDNVWIAAGHNMLGLSMAPATARLIAELVNGQQPFLDPWPYRVGRFAT